MISFDCVHGETLWLLLKSYEIPTKLVNMAKAMYKNCSCAVLDDTSHHEWFEVLSGVQGFLFHIVIGWVMNRTVMNKTVMNNRNGMDVWKTRLANSRE